MRQYDANNLIVHPGNSNDSEVVVEVTPELAGWEYISFQLRRLPAGRSWTFSTGGYEMAIVILSGCIGVESDRGQWLHVGKRDSVFKGLPYALYLPRHASCRSGNRLRVCCGPGAKRPGSPTAPCHSA